MRLSPCWSSLSTKEGKRQYELSPSSGVRDSVHQKRLFYEKYIRAYSPMKVNITTKPAILTDMEHSRIEQIKNKLRYLERWLFSIISEAEDFLTNEVDYHPVSRSLWSMPSRVESKEESKENDLNDEGFPYKLHQIDDIIATIRLSPSSILSIEEEKFEYDSLNSEARDSVHQKRLFYEKYIRSSSPKTISLVKSTRKVLAKSSHNIEHSRIEQIKNKLRYLERWPFSVVSEPDDISTRGTTPISIEMNDHLTYYYTTLAF